MEQDDSKILTCIHETRAHALATAIDHSCETICASRFVDSREEAIKLAAGQEDPLNNKYNRFVVFFFAMEDHFTEIDCSIYINRNFNEIYISVDDIPGEELRLKNLPRAKIFGTIRFDSYEKDMADFADNQLEPFLKHYYEGSMHDLSDNSYELMYVDNGDVEGVAVFTQGVKNLKPLRTAINMRNGCSFFLNSISADQHKELMLVFNDILYVMDSMHKSYRYIRTGDYLWSVNVEYPRYNFEDKQSKEILFFEV